MPGAAVIAAASVATTYEQAVAHTVPLAGYRFGESVGPTAAEMTGRFPGTYVGAPTLGVAGALTGDTNTAVTLNGTTQNVTANDDPLLDTANGPISINAWVKRATTGTNQGIVSKGDGAWYLRLSTGNQLNFLRSNQADLATGTGTITDTTTWHMVTMTYAGANGAVIFYIDGALDRNAGATAANLVSNAMQLQIGSDRGVELFSGSLDETAIWDRVLTATEIATLYTRAMNRPATSALFVGGANVLKDDAGALYGAPLESIEVVEAGPGGVSSCTFSIDDPTKVINIADGLEVQFWNLTANVPRFRGYVDHWSYEPEFGGQGRVIKVTCIGVEAWLDWAKVTDDPGVYSVTTGIAISEMARRNAPKLRAFFDSLATFPPRAGNFDYPIGGLGPTGPMTFRMQLAGATPALFGLSARDAIQTLWNSSTALETGTGNYIDPYPILCTVDYYLGLRVWEEFSTNQPADYTTLTVTDTTAGALVAEGLEHKVEPGDPIRAVYVKGGNAAGTLLVGDGTGITGRTEILNDATILDAVTARSRGVNMMAASAPQVRGSFTLSDFTPPTTVHAGSLLSLTDAATGLAAAALRIFEIRKTFTGARETWVVSYGGLPPSAARLIRKLTRAVAA